MIGAGIVGTDSLAELRQAYALDPLNGEIQYHLACNYRFMRLYAEGEKFQDELAAKQADALVGVAERMGLPELAPN